MEFSFLTYNRAFSLYETVTLFLKEDNSSFSLQWEPPLMNLFYKVEILHHKITLLWKAILIFLVQTV